MNIFVSAGSYSEFYYSKYHVDGYTYCCETYNLIGRRNFKIIFTGTYYKHRNYQKILLVAKMQDAEIIYD
jgi:hypothetical protein